MHCVNSRRLGESVENVQGQVEEGRAVVSGLMKTLECQAEQLSSFEQDIERVEASIRGQQQDVQSLTSTLEEETNFLKKLMTQYDRKLAEQETAISEQDKALQAMLRSRLRMDFGLDVAMVLLSAYFSDSRVVNFASNSFLKMALFPFGMEAARQASLQRNVTRVCSCLFVCLSLSSSSLSLTPSHPLTPSHTLSSPLFSLLLSSFSI